MLLSARPGASAEVSGRVVGFPDGEPLSGVEILAIDRGGGAAAASSDAAGDFVVQDVDPTWVRLRARPPMDVNRVGAYFDDQYFFCGADELDAREGPGGLDIELPAGGEIIGTLLRGDGAAVEGVEVTARGLDFYNQFLVRTATSAADGTFTIRGLDSIVLDGEPVPGLYLLSATEAGAPAAYFGGGWVQEEATPVSVSRGEETELVFELPDRVTLVGAVRAAGEPVEGAIVRAHVVGHGPVGGVPTASDGTFEVPAVPGAAARVEVVAAGYARAWSGGGATAGDVPEIPITGGETVDVGPVHLEAEAVLQVRLEASEPDRVRVRVRRVPDGAVLGDGRTDAGGLARIEGLPAETVTYELLPPAGSPLPAGLGETVDLSSDAPSESFASLPDAGFIEGVVRRREGGPLRGARVEAVVLDPDPDLLPPPAARTDGDGRFRLGPLGPGDVLVRASWEPFCSGDPGRVPIHAPTGRTEGEGRVVPVASGAVVELAPIDLPLDADRDGMDDVWELLWGLDPTRGDATSDPDGDGVTNLEEYRGRTDPLGARRVPGACSQSGRPAAPLGPILALIAARRRRRAPSTVC